MTFVVDGIERFSRLIDDGIDICFNDEHLSKVYLPIEVTDDGIDICVNDEHWPKAKFPIEVTDDGIDICINDEHP